MKSLVAMMFLLGEMMAAEQLGPSVVAWAKWKMAVPAAPECRCAPDGGP